MVRAFSVSASIFLMATSAAAIPADDPAQIEDHQALQTAMDSAMAQLMEPGPKQDGWNKGGVDVYGLVQTAPGGTRQNYLLSIDKEGERDITVVDADKTDNYLPKSWKLVLKEGETQAHGASINLTMAPVDGPFFLAGWDNRRRVGDAFCSDGAHGAELYEASDETAQPEIPRVLIPTMFASIVKHLKDKVLCWRFDRQGEEFKVTYFLEDGTTLPAMSAYEERVTIVPASSIGKLLKKEEVQN